MIAPAPCAQEAAAIAAAIDRFTRDTAPPAPAAAPRRSGWLEAALHEGVSRRPEILVSRSGH